MPSDETICRQHLSDRDVVKQNRIKCKQCNQELGVKDSGFQSNEPLTQLLENHSYLSGEEISLACILICSLSPHHSHLNVGDKSSHRMANRWDP